MALPRLLLLLCASALASAAPQEVFRYEGDDGSSHYMEGEPGVAVRGGFTFPSPEGDVYAIEYTADAGGFRPEGAHIPTQVDDTNEVSQAKAVFYASFKEMEAKVKKALEEAENEIADDDVEGDAKTAVVVEAIERKKRDAQFVVPPHPHHRYGNYYNHYNQQYAHPRYVGAYNPYYRHPFYPGHAYQPARYVPVVGAPISSKTEVGDDEGMMMMMPDKEGKADEEEMMDDMMMDEIPLKKEKNVNYFMYPSYYHPRHHPYFPHTGPNGHVQRFAPVNMAAHGVFPLRSSSPVLVPAVPNIPEVDEPAAEAY